MVRHLLVFCFCILFQCPPGNGNTSFSASQAAQNADELPTGSINDVEFSVTIIGSGNPQYNPERSGPSALVQYKGIKFLVDMGNGTRAQLEKLGFVRRNSPDALLITHHHLDHNEEFIPMVHQKFMMPDNFLIAGPSPIKEMTNYVVKFYNEDLDYRKQSKGQTFDENNINATVKELKGDTSFTWRGVQITTTEVPHSIYTLAYRFDAGGKSIVISGDLSYTPNLGKLAKDADILVIDSQIIRKNAHRNRAGNARKNTKKPTNTAHASIDDAAKMAAEAGVKTLIITHLPNANIDEEATKTKIAEQFKGRVFIARDFLSAACNGQVFMQEQPNP